MNGPKLTCPGCEKIVSVPGICQDCKDQYGIGVEEAECPGCGALVDVTGIGEYNMVNCHNCGIDLEIHKGTLVEV